MSIFIYSPLNQIIKFTEKFVHENLFLKEFFKKLYEYISKIEKNNLNEKSITLEEFTIRESNVLVEIFNKKIPELGLKEIYLNEIIKNYFDSISQIDSKSILDFIKSIIGITPYVLDEFLTVNLERVKFNLIFNNDFNLSLFNFLALCLDIGTLIPQKQVRLIILNELNNVFEEIIQDCISKSLINKTEKIFLFIFDNVEIFLEIINIFTDIQKNSIEKIGFSEVFLSIFNTLLFSSKQLEYVDFKYQNVQALYKNAISINLIIECLMQVNKLIEFIKNFNLESVTYSNYLDLFKRIKLEFFKYQKRVLYFFIEENSCKIYRKRVLAISNDKVFYVPFITRDKIDQKLFEYLYGDIDVLLQRAPYFYLGSDENKHICICLENYLTTNNKFCLLMSSFDIVEKLFLRYYNYLFIKQFIDLNRKEISEKYNISIEIPFSIVFNLSQENIKFLKEHKINNSEKNLEIENIELFNNFSKQIIESFLIKMNSNGLNFPIIIKPNEGEVHEMYLIISESGIHQFFNFSNFAKLLKYKNYILQRFINHDGIIFKNFFINKRSYTFIRPSLPNLEGNNLNLEHFKSNCFNFKNEFLYKKEDENFWKNIDNPHEKNSAKNANYDFMDYVSTCFSRCMNINLFGLDFIFDRSTNSYYIIECNYFPSYRELKEKISTEFSDHIVSYHDDYVKKESNHN